MEKIKLTQGQFAIVDDEDFEEINKHKWYSLFNKGTDSFYAVRSDYSGEKKKLIRMHRQIMNSQKEMHTDHINHNTLDNRKCNLRSCTNSQNQMNAKMRSDNTSGTTGVIWHKATKRWRGQIKINQKHAYLGYFKNKQDAINARKEAEIKYFGEFRYNGDAI